MKNKSETDRGETLKDVLIQNALKQTFSLTEPFLKVQFLNLVEISSKKVRACIQIEFNLLTMSDFNKKKVELMRILGSFDDQECIEYLLVYKKWFAFKYRLYPERLKLSRANEISEVSLREPIFFTKPILYIEYITLTNTFPNIANVANRFPPLDEQIQELVTKYGIRPDKKMIEQQIKKERKINKKLPKGQQNLF